MKNGGGVGGTQLERERAMSCGSLKPNPPVDIFSVDGGMGGLSWGGFGINSDATQSQRAGNQVSEWKVLFLLESLLQLRSPVPPPAPPKDGSCVHS